ncbi:MAG: glycosyltransferase family 4 protein [Vicinamibacteraceae bacterium]
MHPELTSTGYYVSAIARHLAVDRPVTVLCGQPTYSAWGTRAPRREQWHGVEIRRCRGTTFDKNHLAGRLTNMLTLGLSAFAAALGQLRRGDVVLVVTNPPVLPLLVALACWCRGAIYVPVIHDQYPDILVAVAGLSERSLVVRVLRAVNRRLFAGAHRIVVVGRDMRERLARHYPGVEAKVDVVPNWAEADTVTPSARDGNALAARLGLEGAFVLLYAGNLGRAQELATLIEGAARLSDDPRVHLLVVGDGAGRTWLEREVQARGLRNVTLLGPRPRPEQQEFLAACDVGLVPLVAGMWGVSVPSRLYNFLAAGRPVIGVVEPGSEVDRVVREHGVGWSVRPGDVAAFVAAVRDAASDPSRLAVMGRRARLAVDAHYAGPPSLAGYRALVREAFADAPDAIAICEGTGSV